MATGIKGNIRPKCIHCFKGREIVGKAWLSSSQILSGAERAKGCLQPLPGMSGLIKYLSLLIQIVEISYWNGKLAIIVWDSFMGPGHSKDSWNVVQKNIHKHMHTHMHPPTHDWTSCFFFYLAINWYLIMQKIILKSDCLYSELYYFWNKIIY